MFRGSSKELHSSERNDSEHGAVLVEWAIVAAGLFLGFIISFDVAQAINRYMLLTQATYEGTRFASRVPGMEPGIHTDISPTEADKVLCRNKLATPIPCNHYFVQQRIARAIENLNILAKNGAGTSATISTEYIPSGSGLGASDDTVSAQVQSTFNGILLRSIPLRVDHQMSYLYETT